MLMALGLVLLVGAALVLARGGRTAARPNARGRVAN
jgi:hypothetical protein